MRGDHSTIAATRWQQRVVIIRHFLLTTHCLHCLPGSVYASFVGVTSIFTIFGAGTYACRQRFSLPGGLKDLCYPTKTKPPFGGWKGAWEETTRAVPQLPYSLVTTDRRVHLAPSHHTPHRGSLQRSRRMQTTKHEEQLEPSSHH